MMQSELTNRADISALLKKDGYKLIKGVVEDLDIGHVTASMSIRSGNRLVSLLLPVKDVKLSGAETGRPIYCLMNGKDVLVFRDINYMMRKILNK
ncbi:hypothetical protein [Seleniivibrio woodruffii]|uniref:Uncharacterized protein n=1 Tax=Seleniivibrio woodruffii TaxID=1078050 RepID=A0A4R1KCN9_9BACT|nr:hypothetical protein [Seleniivibrio woodruffii]TCK62264.1 hypothetical protein C8D98_0785 [Seleniivibrio woodruffii]TVZ34618.1 hypothetical protein OF66_0208 [Seleniivibrio woodruffii]